MLCLGGSLQWPLRAPSKAIEMNDRIVCTTLESQINAGPMHYITPPHYHFIYQKENEINCCSGHSVMIGSLVDWKKTCFPLYFFYLLHFRTDLKKNVIEINHFRVSPAGLPVTTDMGCNIIDNRIVETDSHRSNASRTFMKWE